MPGTASLGTDTVKYGALSTDAGPMLINWPVQPGSEGARVLFQWRETGGPTVLPSTRKGFGSQVIVGGLGHELDADVSLDYQPEGLVCTINMPVPRGARDV